MNGKVTTISGTMFGGKSDALITEIKKISVSGRPFVVFSPEQDTRVEEEKIIKSRTGQSFPSNVIENSEFIFTHIDSSTEYVFIDEAQLFDECLPLVVRGLRSEGIHVVLAGLELDFKGRIFGNFSEIVAFSDQIIRLTSVCNECKEPDARMVARKIDGEYDMSESDETIIDGSKKNIEYIPLCTNCYNKEVDFLNILSEEDLKTFESVFKRFKDREKNG